MVAFSLAPLSPQASVGMVAEIWLRSPPSLPVLSGTPSVEGRECAAIRCSHPWNAVPPSSWGPLHNEEQALLREAQRGWVTFSRWFSPRRGTVFPTQHSSPEPRASPLRRGCSETRVSSESLSLAVRPRRRDGPGFLSPFRIPGATQLVYF